MADANDIWEKKLQDPSATPMSLPLNFLKTITCDFSAEQELGRGGYGVVYKGVLTSGKLIAVKKLFEIHLLEDNKFHKEVSYLMGMKHQNVVQFVGYCAESSWEAMRLPGSVDYIFAELPKRLLCFEYVCNESLDKYISDESSGLEWNMRYEIIRGICDGLHYLHGERHLIHLDLKPENILLGTNMDPKIADFGLSKIFGDKQSRIITESCAGTRGYMAPEYLNQGAVSIKADIFSLGVIIIEIVTGRRDYPLSVIPYFQHFNENDSPQSNDASNQQFIEKILHTWRNRLQKSEGDIVKLEQIRVCAELGIQCTQVNPGKRPVTQHIIDQLDEVKVDGSIKTGMISTWSASCTASEHDEVTKLLQKLASQNVLDQRGAAGTLRQLVKRNPECRACIGDSGGIPVLVSLLSTNDVSTQEHAVTALLRVSVHQENRRRIVSSGAVPGLVRVLERGSMEARENAAAALFSLSVVDEYKVTIGVSGSIPPLLLLLSTGSRRGKKDAAAALFNLCLYQGNKSRAVRAGSVPILLLLELLTVTGNGMLDESLAILAILSNSPEGTAAISAAAAIPSLVGVIRNGTPGNKGNAAAILLRLCDPKGEQQQQNLAQAQEHGLGSLLVELAESGTDRGKSKAIRLLQLMNN